MLYTNKVQYYVNNYTITNSSLENVGTITDQGAIYDRNLIFEEHVHNSEQGST